MIHFKRLDHVKICIPSGKEHEARQFYTKIIGLTEIPKLQALIPNGGSGIRSRTYNCISGRKQLPVNQKDTRLLNYPIWMKRNSI
jgi:4-hydroxyphenylpyruvate dioxygenase-like putative hemolysin